MNLSQRSGHLVKKIVATVAMFLLTTAGEAAVPLYTLQELPTIAGWNLFEPGDVNDHGDVVGYGRSSTNSVPGSGFLWSGAELELIENSRGINNAGQRIGAIFSPGLATPLL
jgi:hypothetical protein